MRNGGVHRTLANLGSQPLWQFMAAISQVRFLALLGQGNSKFKYRLEFGQEHLECRLHVIRQETVVFILGGCHLHVLPSAYRVMTPFQV